MKVTFAISNVKAHGAEIGEIAFELEYTPEEFLVLAEKMPVAVMRLSKFAKKMEKEQQQQNA